MRIERHLHPHFQSRRKVHRKVNILKLSPLGRNEISDLITLIGIWVASNTDIDAEINNPVDRILHILEGLEHGATAIHNPSRADIEESLMRLSDSGFIQNTGVLDND